MPHTRETRCDGWTPGPFVRGMCHLCWKLGTEATRTGPKLYAPTVPTLPPVEVPYQRPPCIHLGPLIEPAGKCADSTWFACAKFDHCRPHKECVKCVKHVNAYPKITLSEMFGGVPVMAFCITIERRADRWAWFQDNCLIDDVAKATGIDGKYASPPSWWRAGNGAWGCHLSHHALIRTALDAGLVEANGVLLVLEDDALFEPDFAERTRQYLAAVPDDWQQLYIGGEHLRGSQPVNRMVVRGMNINRAHAYAVRGQFIAQLNDHLSACNERKIFPHHVDHRMGMLHPSIKCYCPSRWILGQRGGVSEIGTSYFNDRFWR